MKTLYLVLFDKHIRSMAMAEGKKKIWYAFANIIFIALSFLFAWFLRLVIVKLKNLTLDPKLAITLIIILSIAIAITFMHGGISQVILLFVALIGLFKKGERLANLVTFLICGLTIAGLVMGIVILSIR